MQHAGLSRFLKYVLSGSTAVLSRLVILWIGVELIGLAAVLSSFIGACVSVTVNYLLQHKFVYQKSGNHVTFFRRFIMIVIIMQAIGLILFWALISFTSIYYMLAQVLVIGAIFIANYIINSHYTFSDKN